MLTLPFSDKGPVYLSSVQEIEKVAGFHVLEPTWLPPGVTFKRGEASDHFAILEYQRADQANTEASLFGIMEGQPEPGSSPLFPQIGASAQVEVVQIGTAQGEYVKGGWRSRNAPPPSAGKIDLDLEWDPTLPSQQLQWQVGERVFTIHAGSDLTKDDLCDRSQHAVMSSNTQIYA